jgi:hypothetical protein
VLLLCVRLTCGFGLLASTLLVSRVSFGAEDGMARCITAEALHQGAVCVAANLDELTG